MPVKTEYLQDFFYGAGFLHLFLKKITFFYWNNTAVYIILSV